MEEVGLQVWGLRQEFLWVHWEGLGHVVQSQLAEISEVQVGCPGCIEGLGGRAAKRKSLGWEDTERHKQLIHRPHPDCDLELW